MARSKKVAKGKRVEVKRGPYELGPRFESRELSTLRKGLERTPLSLRRKDPK